MTNNSFINGFVLFKDAVITWWLVMSDSYEPDNIQTPVNFSISILSEFTLDYYVWDKIFGIVHTPWD